MSYEEGSQIIQAEDIDLRIQQLQEQEELEDWEEDELRDMLAFRQAAQDTLHVWEDGTTFIHDRYFEEWALSEAQDIYGDEVVASGYFMIEKWTQQRRDEFEEITYGNTTYLADGR